MMKQISTKKVLLFIGCMVLIAAMALGITGCISSEPSETPESKKTFTVTVTDLQGKETEFTYTSDLKTVGEVLQAEGLISGEEGPYGLYIKTVNGITLDYDTDGMYWSFYVEGEYAIAGIDQTAVTEGAHYALKPESME